MERVDLSESKMNSLIVIVLLGSTMIRTIHSMTSSETSGANSVTEIPVRVTRRPSGDIYFYPLSQVKELESKICNTDGNTTYLVVENQCINNQYLFKDCTFAITPVSQLNTSRLALDIQISHDSTTGLTTNSGGDIASAVVVFTNEQQLVDNSTCHISSLEVYRGINQAFKISHKGFSLSSNSTIEIHEDQLLYDSQEYEGELYRMNLSCSDGVPSESGCLFFKTRGTANITEAKFNCTVPGTLPISNSSECPAPTQYTTNRESDHEPTSRPPSQMSTMATAAIPTTVVSQNNLTLMEPESPLVYVVVGTAGTITIIIILSSLVITCLVLYIRHIKQEWKGGQNRDTAGKEQHQYEAIKDRLSFRNGIALNSVDFDDLAIDEKTVDEPKYAEIGATYQEIMPRTKDAKHPDPKLEMSETDGQQPPHEYNTLTLVGGKRALEVGTESALNTSIEQYGQLLTTNDYHNVPP